LKNFPFNNFHTTDYVSESEHSVESRMLGLIVIRRD
jgi:hypothetical protein